MRRLRLRSIMSMRTGRCFSARLTSVDGAPGGRIREYTRLSPCARLNVSRNTGGHIPLSPL
jgi:hypothetical protein